MLVLSRPNSDSELVLVISMSASSPAVISSCILPIYRVLLVFRFSPSMMALLGSYIVAVVTFFSVVAECVYWLICIYMFKHRASKLLCFYKPPHFLKVMQRISRLSIKCIIAKVSTISIPACSKHYISTCCSFKIQLFWVL